MVSGVQGKFLKLLVQLTNAKSVLEIGCFTGIQLLRVPHLQHLAHLHVHVTLTHRLKLYCAHIYAPTREHSLSVYFTVYDFVEYFASGV